MGLDRTIRFPEVDTPTWEAIHAELARLGVNTSLRMIDGLPAFPDEIPLPGWNELRLGLPSGMVTIRRGSGLFTCAIWGNADEQLQLDWYKVIFACARVGSGTIQMPTGQLTPEEFARNLSLKVQ